MMKDIHLWTCVLLEKRLSLANPLTTSAQVAIQNWSKININRFKAILKGQFT